MMYTEQTNFETLLTTASYNCRNKGFYGALFDLTGCYCTCQYIQAIQIWFFWQWKVLTDKENRQKLERDQRDLQKRQIREAVKKLAMKVKYSFIVVDLVSSLSISGNVSNINIFIFKNVVQRSWENLASF